jgi:hypothetical protein
VWSRSLSKRAPSTRAGHRTKTTLTVLTTRRRFESPHVRSTSSRSSKVRQWFKETSAKAEEDDGQRNRRLLAFSFRFQNRRAKNAQCVPRNVPHTAVPEQVVGRRHKALVSLRLTPKAKVWTRGAFTASRSAFGVSVIVTYTCRRAVRCREAEGGGLLRSPDIVKQA